MKHYYWGGGKAWRQGEAILDAEYSQGEFDAIAEAKDTLDLRRWLGAY